MNCFRRSSTIIAVDIYLFDITVCIITGYAYMSIVSLQVIQVKEQSKSIVVQ